MKCGNSRLVCRYSYGVRSTCLQAVQANGPSHELLLLWMILVYIIVLHGSELPAAVSDIES